MLGKSLIKKGNLMDRTNRGQQRILLMLGDANTYEDVIKAEKALTTELNVNRLFDSLEEYLQSAVTDRLAVVQEEVNAFKEV